MMLLWQELEIPREAFLLPLACSPPSRDALLRLNHMRGDQGAERAVRDVICAGSGAAESRTPRAGPAAHSAAGGISRGVPTKSSFYPRQ